MNEINIILINIVGEEILNQYVDKTDDLNNIKSLSILEGIILSDGILVDKLYEERYMKKYRGCTGYELSINIHQSKKGNILSSELLDNIIRLANLFMLNNAKVTFCVYYDKYVQDTEGLNHGKINTRDIKTEEELKYKLDKYINDNYIKNIMYLYAKLILK